MPPRSRFVLTTLFLVILSACTIQGLPYPTDTPDPNLITPDLQATREMAEAGMFPSSTPEPTKPPQVPSPTANETTLASTPAGSTFLVPSLTLKLAYIKEGNVWYWEEGQAALQLTNQGDATLVALSDDASQVAYAREIDYGIRELWAVDSDGSENRVLVDRAAFKKMTIYPDDLTGAPLQLDWLPGTDLVVFNTRIVSEGPGMVPKHELRTVNAVSRTMTVLAEIEFGGEFSISPDASRIAMVLPDKISLVNPDGSGLRELYNFPHLNTGSEWWYYPPLAWTLDSTAVRVIIPPENPMFEADLPTRIIHLPADGSTPRVVSEVLTIPVLFTESMLSPDGRQLAYLGPGASAEPGQGILYYSSTEGGDAEAYDEGQITLSAWSPDNRHFIYSVNELNKIGMVGESSRSLNAAGYLFKVRFVDASHFLYLVWSEAGQQLWQGTLDGSVFLIAESSTGIEYDFVR